MIRAALAILAALVVAALIGGILALAGLRAAMPDDD